MTDPIVNQMLPASFKGISFLVRSESSPACGRKIVLHEYINSSKRYVEDLGQLPPKFTISAYVSGRDFKLRAASLEGVLNKAGAGRLVLPNFGAVSAYAMQYSKNATQKSVGIIEFNLSFATGEPGAGPGVADANLQTVYQFGDTARSALEDAFADLYTEASSLVASSSFQESLTSLTDSIDVDISGVMPESFSPQLSKITGFVSQNAALFASSPVDLAKSLFAGIPSAPGMWQTVSLGLSDQVGGLDNLSKFYNDFDSVDLFPATTAYRILANNNNLRLAESSSIASLLTGYEVAAASTYNTTQDIQNVRGGLEDAYSSIFRENVSDGALQAVSSVRSAFTDARLAALSLLDKAEQTTPKTTQVELASSTNPLLTSYNLYAEKLNGPEELETRTTLLRSLNPAVSSVSSKGGYEVFTNV